MFHSFSGTCYQRFGLRRHSMWETVDRLPVYREYYDKILFSVASKQAAKHIRWWQKSAFILFTQSLNIPWAAKFYSMFKLKSNCVNILILIYSSLGGVIYFKPSPGDLKRAYSFIYFRSSIHNYSISLLFYFWWKKGIICDCLRHPFVLALEGHTKRLGLIWDLFLLTQSDTSSSVWGGTACCSPGRSLQSERERETVREIREREEKEREIPTSTEVNSTILCGCLPMGFETKQQAEPSGWLLCSAVVQ